MVLMGEPQIATGDVQFAPEIQAGNVIMMIVVLALMIVGAYYLTKYVNKRTLTKGMKKRPAGAGKRRLRTDTGRLLCVADRIVVDRDKTIMVIEFKGKYYLLSTTPQEIHCIDSVPIPPEDMEEEEQLRAQEEEEAAEAVAPMTFGAFMGAIGTQIKNKVYAFFHKGELPPPKASFESHLKQKLEEEEQNSFQNSDAEIKNTSDDEDKKV